jgi:hypothetical protein
MVYRNYKFSYERNVYIYLIVKCESDVKHHNSNPYTTVYMKMPYYLNFFIERNTVKYA